MPTKGTEKTREWSGSGLPPRARLLVQSSNVKNSEKRSINNCDTRTTPIERNPHRSRNHMRGNTNEPVQTNPTYKLYCRIPPVLIGISRAVCKDHIRINSESSIPRKGPDSGAMETRFNLKRAEYVVSVIQLRKASLYVYRFNESKPPSHEMNGR
ncbi:hypothetical protein BDZ89DRAFT_1058485 [Hymenopellis radicata]|nr:hypothetical protein BDZ89DRAFT_1058485 [Hymenopellis radicata]